MFLVSVLTSGSSRSELIIMSNETEVKMAFSEYENQSMATAVVII